MRKLAFLSPTWWVSDTGQQLAELGGDYFKLAIYLMTCPFSEMWGVYYLPRTTLLDEARLTAGAAETVLAWMRADGFADYDAGTQSVWVREMAWHQVNLGRVLDPADKKAAAANIWYRTAPRSPFLGPWHDRYARVFCVTEPRRDGLHPPFYVPEQPPQTDPLPAPFLAVPVDVVAPVNLHGPHHHRCGRACLPTSLHQQFLDGLGPNMPPPELEAWYGEVLAELEASQDVVANVWKFWRGRFERRFGAPLKQRGDTRDLMRERTVTATKGRKMNVVDES